jgi:hypothetical protein
MISNGTRTRPRGSVLASKPTEHHCQGAAVKSSSCDQQFYGKSPLCEQPLCQLHHYDAYATSLLCQIANAPVDEAARTMLHKGTQRCGSWCRACEHLSHYMISRAGVCVPCQSDSCCEEMWVPFWTYNECQLTLLYGMPACKKIVNGDLLLMSSLGHLSWAAGKV